jgi:hypothetical protein
LQGKALLRQIGTQRGVGGKIAMRYPPHNTKHPVPIDGSFCA